MHTILVALGTAGDVHPLVGVGVRMVARGHRVTLLSSDYFAPLARKSGFEFHSLGTVEQFHALYQNPDMWHWAKGLPTVWRSYFGPAMRPTYEYIAENYVPGETVVAISTLALGARIAQDKLGVPVASLHNAPSAMRSLYVSPKFKPWFMPDWLPKPLKAFQFWLGDKLAVDELLDPPVNALRAELGLPPVSGVFRGWMHSPLRVWGQFPDWFAPPQPDWPPHTRLAGFPMFDESGVAEPPVELQRFLDAGEPPIAFTPGSAYLHGREFFSVAAEACGQLGRRGLLLTRFPDQIPAQLPPGVRHVDYAPFSWLLPRTAAVVHHGGIGTTSQALSAGIPQLIMPMVFDQFDNAARLERLGVGATLRPERFKTAKVAQALLGLLSSPETGLRCRQIAERFPAQDQTSMLCDDLKELARARSGISAPGSKSPSGIHGNSKPVH